MKLQYIITQDKAEYSDKMKENLTLIIDYQEIPLYSARLLSTTPAVNYGRFMVCHKCINTGAHCLLCIIFVKEDKTGTEDSEVGSMYYNTW